jgi:cysteine/glycine-rich protein
MSLNEQCPACSRLVYPQEAKLAACGRFHPQCFKCSNGLCNKFLSSQNACENGGKLFCKECYKKNFLLSGFAYQGDDSTIRPGTAACAIVKGADVENGCPRCHKKVFDAEKRYGGGKDYHKGCFRCKNCNRSLDSTTVAAQAGEIYCKNCYHKNFSIRGKI